MRIWLEALWMLGVGGLQVHGICSWRLVYKEVVEVWSSYKKSYFWWWWLLWLNLVVRGEHLTSSQLSWVAAWLLVTLVCPVYLVEESCYFGVIYLSLGWWWAGKVGKVQEGSEVASWKRWENSEVASWERWDGSEEARWERSESSEVTRWEVPGCIRGLGTKLCCIASGKWNVSRVSLQALDITYTII